MKVIDRNFRDAIFDRKLSGAAVRMYILIAETPPETLDTWRLRDLAVQAKVTERTVMNTVHKLHDAGLITFVSAGRESTEKRLTYRPAGSPGGSEIAFIEERVGPPKKHSPFETSQRVYEVYKDWCDGRGLCPVSQIRLGKALVLEGFPRSRGTGGVRRYQMALGG